MSNKALASISFSFENVEGFSLKQEGIENLHIDTTETSFSYDIRGGNGVSEAKQASFMRVDIPISVFSKPELFDFSCLHDFDEERVDKDLTQYALNALKHHHNIVDIDLDYEDGSKEQINAPFNDDDWQHNAYQECRQVDDKLVLIIWKDIDEFNWKR